MATIGSDENVAPAGYELPLRLSKFFVGLAATGIATVASAQGGCGTPDQHFAIQIALNQQHELLKTAASVPRGTSARLAIASLGKPDNDTIVASKGSPAKFIDHHLTWYVARTDQGMVNEHDRYVEMHFSKDDKLTRTDYHCLEAAGAK